jgi:thioredoxin reductase (NADPH)
VPGEELSKVIHYYREAHPYYNQDVLVVGGKNSAAIAALELHWTGARVTLVHHEDRIHPNVKYWLKPNIENRIKSGEIKAYFKSRVKEVRQHEVVIATPNGNVTLKNDYVFAMIGYRPDFVFMQEHGIHLNLETMKPDTDVETLESERPGVYLAGVIVAGTHTNEIFIENGRFHGKQIAAAIENSLSAGIKGEG